MQNQILNHDSTTTVCINCINFTVGEIRSNFPNSLLEKIITYITDLNSITLNIPEQITRQSDADSRTMKQIRFRIDNGCYQFPDYTNLTHRFASHKEFDDILDYLQLPDSEYNLISDENDLDPDDEDDLILNPKYNNLFYDDDDVPYGQNDSDADEEYDQDSEYDSEADDGTSYGRYS